MSEAIAYYPGCSGLGTSKEYDASTRAVCAAVGLSLVDIPDWSCCGSTPAHTKDHTLSAALAARNLQLVAGMGLKSAITPCPSCLTNLRTANHRMEQPAFTEKVNKLLDEPYDGSVNTQSVLQALIEVVGLDSLAAAVRTPLTGLTVACYYGCIMNRPPELMAFDDCENPMAMDNILSAHGGHGRAVPAEGRVFAAPPTACPGPTWWPSSPASSWTTARSVGADMVAVACPLCQMNLDLAPRPGQPDHGHQLPDAGAVLHPQLMGVCAQHSGRGPRIFHAQHRSETGAQTRPWRGATSQAKGA